jgi:O-antigen/teichoic acid export membrane protein
MLRIAPAAEHTRAVNAPIKIGARRTSADIAVQIVGRLANLAIGVVVTLAIVRALGDDRFGEWSTIFAVTQIAIAIGELGLSGIAIRRAASEPEAESMWMGALVGLRLLLALPLMLVSVVTILLIAPTNEAAIAGVVISLMMLINVPGAASAVFQLRVRNDISTAILTFNSLAWAGAVFVIVAFSGRLIALAVALVGVAAATSAVTLFMARRMVRIQLRGTRAYWGRLLRVGVAVGAAGILVTLYVRLDQILVLEISGRHQAGLYAAAYRVLEQVQFIPSAVMTTLFPLIASSYPTDQVRVRSLLQQAGEYLALASLPILGFTIVANHPIVTLLFGSSFSGAGPALPILMAAFVSISFGYLAGSMVVILELQRRFLAYAAFGLVLNVVLNLILIPRYGFLAAAWITLATEVAVLSLTARSILRVLAMKPQFGRLLRTLGAAALMSGATAACRAAGLPLSVLVLVAGVSYIVAVGALRAVSVREVLAILRKEQQPT